MSKGLIDPNVIGIIRELKSLSVRDLARFVGTDPGNLSRFLNGRGGISSEKQKKILEKLSLEENGLTAGIHRWKTPSMVVWDIEKVEYVIRTLLPGGGTVVIATRKGIVAQHLIFNQALVFVPANFPDVRIILKYALSIQRINPIAPERGIRLGGLGPGWNWHGGSVADESPMDAFLKLSSESFNRVDADESLTVPDLDAILGISGDSGDSKWTWERLNAVLESKGITPEETARNMGILRRVAWWFSGLRGVTRSISFR